MIPDKVDEVARRLAATTGQPYVQWRPAAIAWWAAGHDLDQLCEWAAEGRVSPRTAIDCLNVLAAHLESTDSVSVWAGRVLVVTVSAVAVVTAVAVAWRIVRWAFA